VNAEAHLRALLPVRLAEVHHGLLWDHDLV